MTIAGELRMRESEQRFFGWRSTQREKQLTFRVDEGPHIPHGRFGGDSPGVIDATPPGRADSPTRLGAIKRLFVR